MESTSPHILNDYAEWYVSQWVALGRAYPEHGDLVREVVRISEVALLRREIPVRQSLILLPRAYPEALLDRAVELAADFGVFCRVVGRAQPDLAHLLMKTGAAIGVAVYLGLTLPAGRGHPHPGTTTRPKAWIETRLGDPNREPPSRC